MSVRIYCNEYHHVINFYTDTRAYNYQIATKELITIRVLTENELNKFTSWKLVTDKWLKLRGLPTVEEMRKSYDKFT